MTEQPRDWDRELAEIDKAMAKQGGVPVGPRGGPATPAPGPAHVPVVPPAAGRRPSVALTWFWTLLAVALAVALPLWPYPKECGLQLFFFLGAAGVTVVAGVVGALQSWASRRGLAHLLCLLVLLWAGVVGASEALPRSGYARQARLWTCPATPTAPVPAPVQPAPGAGPQPAPQTSPRPAPETRPQPAPETSPQPAPGSP